MSNSLILDSLSTVGFREFLYALQQGGWIEFFFPFLLIYAIVLTIMNRAEVFKGNKATRVIIALVFALFSVTFPVSQTCNINIITHLGYCTLGSYMSALFPGVSLFAIGILSLYIIAALLGRDLTNFLGKDNPILIYILGGIGALIVLWQWGNAFFDFGIGGYYGNNWFILLLQDPVLYVIILFLILFWWISKEDDPNFNYSKGNTKVNIETGEQK
ncbi:MAG: hypothetical protein ACMXYB_02310 [Candidatus Woesearchaeota archaeon]